ncbi:hypothetical protein ZWY2020_030818 [Hordeum vulgare]|nr:hypothetical protein ZWY2020_030818 [Hordeum vulgare]
MDPKVLLDFINIWYEDPNTPIDDLKLPPGISHMVATFINEAKWKEQKARQARVAKAKKEKFLKQNLLKLTPNALVSTQAELQVLTDKIYRKNTFTKSFKGEEDNPSASDHEEDNSSLRRKQRRKASSAEEKIEAKRLKETEESAPLDPVPLNVAPSYEMVVIGDQTTKADEEMKDVASEEHTDEEIQIDDSPQPHVPQTEIPQASGGGDENASATKPAEEKQAEENVHSEQAPHSEQADQTPQAEKEAEIP